jgi:uncharacterized protein
LIAAFARAGLNAASQLIASKQAAAYLETETMATPLMPKATAVWLVDNTALSFHQIADFCELHELEVQGIADGDVAAGIKGLDPVSNGQLTREQIERCEADTKKRLVLIERQESIPTPVRRKGPRYTPVSRRQDRPNAIAWLVRYHPELSDAQVSKLVGTTKPTIQAIRDRTHWNSANIKPVDPVSMGLCSQIELDAIVQKAAEKLARQVKKAGGAALKPTAESLAESSDGYAELEKASEPEKETSSGDPFQSKPEGEKESEEEVLSADSVFADFGGDAKKD